jgi:hypothetical protein
MTYNCRWFQYPPQDLPQSQRRHGALTCGILWAASLRKNSGNSFLGVKRCQAWQSSWQCTCGWHFAGCKKNNNCCLVGAWNNPVPTHFIMKLTVLSSALGQHAWLLRRDGKSSSWAKAMSPGEAGSLQSPPILPWPSGGFRSALLEADVLLWSSLWDLVEKWVKYCKRSLHEDLECAIGALVWNLFWGALAGGSCIKSCKVLLWQSCEILLGVLAFSSTLFGGPLAGNGTENLWISAHGPCGILYRTVAGSWKWFLHRNLASFRKGMFFHQTRSPQDLLARSLYTLWFCMRCLVFARACAVEINMNMSQEPFCVEIYMKSARR